MTREQIEEQLNQCAAERHNAIMGATDALKAITQYHFLTGRMVQLAEALKTMLPETAAPTKEA